MRDRSWVNDPSKLTTDSFGKLKLMRSIGWQQFLLVDNNNAELGNSIDAT
jgi:hypothetical protein